ncbi:MAG: aminopeptidase [Bullifex sp.]
MNIKYAERLSDLILTKGVALKKGEKVRIAVGPSVYPYARHMAAKAYEMGAAYFVIDVMDPDLDEVRSRYQSEEDVAFIPGFVKAAADERAADGYVNIRIDSNEDRIGQEKGEPDRMALIQKSFRTATKKSSDKYMSNELAWCVTCAPGPKWAESLLGKGKTEDDLADVLSKILRLDRDDCMEAWNEFDTVIKERRSKLNDLKIKSLHYESSVTDFTISLRENASFEGGASSTPDGKSFFPNLPTEELFTTPDMYTAEGYITTTRPVNVMNETTEHVKFTFHEGKVTDVSAQKGEEIIRKYLAIDEGASRIGEVALVDTLAPISQTGLVFGSILIDENASCHIALGSGYPECVKGSETAKTDEALNEMGINTSLMHTDFMVGSADLKITATGYDGKTHVIMENGSFTI